MRRHVIGSFRVMLEQRIAVGRNAGEIALQIAADRRIRVLRNNQRGTRVLHEHIAETGFDTGLRDDLGHVAGDINQPATFGANVERLLLHICTLQLEADAQRSAVVFVELAVA